jgi:hypothetical protein
VTGRPAQRSIGPTAAEQVGQSVTQFHGEAGMWFSAAAAVRN